MTVGFRDAAGVDFDLLFDPYITGTPPAATGFTDAGGVDLAGRYAPIVFGTKGPDVGFRNSAGVDLSNLWAAAGTARYVSSTYLPEEIFFYANSTSGPLTVVASLQLNRDGSVTTSPTGVAGPWYFVTGGTPGDDYDVRYSVLGGAGGTLSGSALNTRLQLNVARPLTLTVTRTTSGAGHGSRNVQVEIIRRSDNVVVSVDSTILRCEADIS